MHAARLHKHAARIGGNRSTPASRRPEPRSEAGFLLIEVVVSTMLVGIVAIAVFAGFDGAQGISADERAHAQGTKLVQQDEERLRGLTTTQLAQLGSSTQTEADNGLCVEKVAAAWRYCEGTAFALLPYSGTVFTITSLARFVSASKAALTCETAGGSADYLLTTSSASWPMLGSRPAVSQSSIVSTPRGAALMVKVINQLSRPVEGVTVTVTGASTSATQVTPAAGCVIFGALTPETVKVAVSKFNWVDNNGDSPPDAKEVTVASGTLASTEFKMAAPGAIVAEFESNGVSTEAIKSDAFYASQTGISAPSDFIGGTAGTFTHSAEVSGLFPFAEPGEPPKENPYTVFAGDCEANNPTVVTGKLEKLKARPAQVEPNAVAKVKVEVPAVNAVIYEGTEAKKENRISKSESAKITNTECSKASAQNREPVPYEHYLSVNATGELEPKYWPYAKQLELCVVWYSAATKKYYTYKSPAPFANSAKGGTATLNIYMKTKGSGYSESGSYKAC
jgi:type II secretory pathway pseudopilin PulG